MKQVVVKGHKQTQRRVSDDFYLNIFKEERNKS